MRMLGKRSRGYDLPVTKMGEKIEAKAEIEAQLEADEVEDERLAPKKVSGVHKAPTEGALEIPAIFVYENQQDRLKSGILTK